MPKITINSFQGGQANDKNAGQAGAFWNAKNIDYRKNSQYATLSKKPAFLFQVNDSIRSTQLWGTGGTLATDIVVFGSGGIYTSAGQQSVLTGTLNTATANNKKIIIRGSSLYEFTSPSSNTLLVSYTGDSSEKRPALDFFGDLIIGNGNKLIRYNIDGSLIQWTVGTTQPIIGGLDGTVVALTMIGQTIYVWCDNGGTTTVYQWDGVSSRPQSFVRYADKSVKNVALLGNSHYWWSSKSDGSIKEVLIGESYRPQVYMKSDYPELPLVSNADNEKNKMAIADGSGGNFLNAIETMGDIVFLPGIGRIFTFGGYFPGDKYSFNAEYTFTGTNITSMLSGGISSGGVDAGGVLLFTAPQGGGISHINMINLGQDLISIIQYADSGELESMEYVAPYFAKGEDDKKYTIPFELPDASCSIKVYEKRDRASTYTLVKTLTYADYPGYQVAEIKTEGRWRTKQFKFELLTTDSQFTPKLYVGFTNETVETGKI